ncbi:two-component system sensor histidine kinase NtrB [Qipengyuania nanhaisediminis]|uniref:two-component system sensor histidine kinase NtrB n=1 Tax=Qipengyuania nanhaisediminis TaxID=604088 RepID=UPI0038B32A88
MAPAQLAERVEIPAHDTSRPDAQAQIAGMGLALVLIDPDTRVAEVNYAAQNLLGRSERHLLGCTLADAIGPLDPRFESRIADNEAGLVAHGIAIRSLDDRGEDQEQRSGQRVDMTLTPLAGHPGWRVVTLVANPRENAPDDDASPGALGAPSVLAHEIKNPLAAIRGAGQLAERKLADGDKKLARMITGEVDRIARLIDRMQQLGASTRDELTPCNLHEAIRSAIATVRAAREGRVVITEAFDPSLPPVLAHREALEQVLINLLSNACDAVEGAQSGSVSVRTRFVSGEGFRAIRLGRAYRLPIEVSVIDNGAGIDPDLRDHIFEPFVSSKRSGQGLGLALVRKLVRDMDGTVSHERDARRGLTHFRLHLQRAEEKDT